MGEGAEKDGMVNVAMECSNKGGKTLDAAWFDLEMVDKGEVFFMNVVFADGRGEDKLQDKEEKPMECVRAEEDYELWLVREEERRTLTQANG